MLYNKKVLIVLLGILILFSSSCASSLYTYDGELVHRGVVIKDYTYSFIVGDCFVVSDKEVRSNKQIKDMIKHYLDDHYYIVDRGELVEVGIVGYIHTDEFLAGGVYVLEENKIYLSLYKNLHKMREMFCHELGHAFVDCLSNEQKMEWGLLYLNRLDEMKLENPMGHKYWTTTNKYKESFPSSYCLFSIGEYIAEIFMFHLTDSKYLEGSFFPESKLVRKHIEELKSNGFPAPKKGNLYKYK